MTGLANGQARADHFLVSRPAESRDAGAGLRLAVSRLGDRKVTGGAPVRTRRIRVKGLTIRVSRVFKLDHALTHRGWDLTDARSCRSSTGALQMAAQPRRARIYAWTRTNLAGVEAAADAASSSQPRGAHLPPPHPRPVALIVFDASLSRCPRYCVPNSFAKTMPTLVA